MEQNSQTQFQQIWYAPAFSSLMTNRSELTMIAGAGALHLGLSLAGYKGWQCPILAATGVPCPGCGLTTAILELLHGDFSASIRTHAFAPLFLFAVVILFTAFLLPEQLRSRLVNFVNRVEIRTGITAWVLSFLMLYWVIRLVA